MPELQIIFQNQWIWISLFHYYAFGCMTEHINMDRTSAKLLLIDDDVRNIFALQAVLKAKKFSSVSVTNALEGIDRLRKDKEIKAVLLDMMMPEMDGYEAMRMIREDAELSDVPVIAVTAQAMPGDRERCLNAGANAYITKPIDVDKLMAVLQEFI